MERKEEKEKEKEASRFRGRAGEGKILTELLWRTWSRFFAIVPSPEERRAPLTDSSSLVQSPPLCAEWTAHSVLPPPPPSACFSPYHMHCFFKGKVHSFLPVPPHPACWRLSHTSSHLLLSKAPCALDRHIVFFLKHLSVSVCLVCIISVFSVLTPQLR